MQKKTKCAIVSIMAVTIFSALISFSVWAYVGPCDWIGRLDFEPPPVIPYPQEIPNKPSNDTISTFAIVGDTQRTSFGECAIGREVNDDETRSIIREISNTPAKFLVSLGDMVFDGGNEKHWQYFDWTIMPLREIKMPILPILGNHEYWGNRAAARNFVEERFQNIRNRTWYSKQNGPLGMVFVNSNHKEMSKIMWEDQMNWLTSLMTEWDLNSGIKGILLFAHHPPYTNSIVVSSDTKIRNDIVKRFCETKKSLAMVTGHAHGYERFENVDEPISCSNQYKFNSSLTNLDIGGLRDQSVQFVVSGGGGGPRPNRLREDYKDSYTGSSPRPFNFLLVVPSIDGIEIAVQGLRKNETRTHSLEEIYLKFIE